MPGRLVGGVVPALAARLAGQGREQREGLLRRRGSRRCRAPRRRRAGGRGRRRASRPSRSAGRPRRRGPPRSAPRSRRGRCCARWPSRATRSPRRRRSCPSPGRRRRGTRASSHRTGHGGSSRDGRRRSRARSTPCGCRSEPACVTSPPRCRRLFETNDDSRASFSSVADRPINTRPPLGSLLRRSRSRRGGRRRPATARPRREARWRAPSPARSGRGRPAAS